MVRARDISRPEPGFFEMKLVKGGHLVPARIFLPCPIVPADHDCDPFEWGRHSDRSRHLMAEIAGEAADIWRVWTSGRPIAAKEFEYLARLRSWAVEHAPHEPAARPHEAVDLNAQPSLF